MILEISWHDDEKIGEIKFFKDSISHVLSFSCFSEFSAFTQDLNDYVTEEKNELLKQLLKFFESSINNKINESRKIRKKMEIDKNGR